MSTGDYQGIRVENPSVPILSGERQWTLVTDVRITGAGGPGGDTFGQLVALDVGADGRIHVFDGSDHMLHVFRPDGVVEATHGREGGGPGEYAVVIGMGVDADGRTWIVDPVNARYTRIAGGEVTTHHRSVPTYRLPWLGGVGSGRELYDGVVMAGFKGEVLLRVDTMGIVQDSFWVETPVLDVPRRGTMEFAIPFAPQPLRVFDPRGYVWLATSHTYEISQVSLEGDTSRSVTVPRPAIPLTQFERDSVDRYVKVLEAAMRVTVSPRMLPASGPILVTLSVGDDGTLWVFSVDGRRQLATQVFDSAGRYLSDLELPVNLLTHVRPVIRSGRLFAVAEDSAGAEFVIGARIVKP